MKEDDNLVLLGTFSSLLDAEIALEHLEFHDVEAMIRKDDNGGMRPWMQQMQCVGIFVFEKDLKKAERVLNVMNV